MSALNFSHASTSLTAAVTMIFGTSSLLRDVWRALAGTPTYQDRQRVCLAATSAAFADFRGKVLGHPSLTPGELPVPWLFKLGRAIDRGGDPFRHDDPCCGTRRLKSNPPSDRGFGRAWPHLGSSEPGIWSHPTLQVPDESDQRRSVGRRQFLEQLSDRGLMLHRSVHGTVGGVGQLD